MGPLGIAALAACAYAFIRDRKRKRAAAGDAMFEHDWRGPNDIREI